MRLWYLSHRRPAKKNEFTEDEKYHNLMTWLILFVLPITDCGFQTAPTNGYILLPSVPSEGQTVTYSCDVGYALDNVTFTVRTCLSTKLWSGRAPLCVTGRYSVIKFSFIYRVHYSIAYNFRSNVHSILKPYRLHNVTTSTTILYRNKKFIPKLLNKLETKS